MRRRDLVGDLRKTNAARIMTVQTVINGVPFGRPYQSPFAVR